MGTAAGGGKRVGSAPALRPLRREQSSAYSVPGAGVVVDLVSAAGSSTGLIVEITASTSEFTYE